MYTYKLLIYNFNETIYFILIYNFNEPYIYIEFSKKNIILLFY